MYFYVVNMKAKYDRNRVNEMKGNTHETLNNYRYLSKTSIMSLWFSSLLFHTQLFQLFINKFPSSTSYSDYFSFLFIKRLF